MASAPASSRAPIRLPGRWTLISAPTMTKGITRATRSASWTSTGAPTRRGSSACSKSADTTSATTRPHSTQTSQTSDRRRTDRSAPLAALIDRFLVVLGQLPADVHRLPVVGCSVSTLWHEYPRRASRDRYGQRDQEGRRLTGVPVKRNRGRRPTSPAGWCRRLRRPPDQAANEPDRPIALDLAAALPSRTAGRPWDPSGLMTNGLAW
jgi:hypothetical protein